MQVVQIRLEGVPSSPQHTGVVRVKHVPTDRNRADLLTKALRLPREAFNRHRASLMRE